MRNLKRYLPRRWVSGVSAQFIKRALKEEPFEPDFIVLDQSFFEMVNSIIKGVYKPTS